MDKVIIDHKEISVLQLVVEIEHEIRQLEAKVEANTIKQRQVRAA